MTVAPAEPCTISMAARRILVAAVFASAVRAGTIASRNGSATVTPSPLRAVRRERCFCVMNIVADSFAPVLLATRHWPAPLVVSLGSTRFIRNAGVLTTPRTNAESFRSCVPASRITRRTAAMSNGSTRRPRA